MTDLESRILNFIQTQFPLVSRPFKVIAEKTGTTEERVLAILRNLSGNGVLRTIRTVINWPKVGFSTLLVGVSVEPPFLDAVAEEINQYETVTHNYSREGERNLWFTLIYECEAEKTGLFAKIMSLPGVKDLREFPAEKIYKIGLVLDV